MPIFIDLDGVEDRNFEARAAGWYDGTIFDIQQETSKAGNPMLTVTYKLEDGGQVWDHLPLTGQARYRLKNLLLSLGVPSEELTGGFTIDERKLLGTPVSIQLDVRPYEGQLRNNVKKVVPRGAHQQQLEGVGSESSGF